MHTPFSKICCIFVSLSLLMLPPSLSVAARRAYPGQIIEQIDFRDVAVGDALKILADQSNLNIVASREAANIRVTMFLRRVTAMEVIQAISKTYNLWYQVDGSANIVRIYTVKEYRLEEVEFKKEETEIFTMKNAKNALDLAETIQNLFSERVLLSYGRNQNELIKDLSQRFARFEMIDGRTSLGQGGGSGGGTGGGGNANQNFGGSQTGQYGQSGQSGVRKPGQLGQTGQSGQSGQQTNIDEQLRNVAKVLEKLEEANGKGGLSTLLTGDSAKSTGLMENTIRRLAPIYVGVIKHQNRVLVRTRDVDAMNEIRKLFKQLDNESSMLLMEVKVLSIDLSDGYESLFDFSIKSGSFEVATLNQTGVNLTKNAIKTAAGLTNPALLATVISDNFNARLQLLEREGRVTALATPMLTTLNQEVSRVFVGTEQPIVTGYSSSSTSNQAVAIGGVTSVNQPILVPETELRAIGTTLLLTPNINADRTVSMQLLVEQSTIAPKQGQIPVQIGNELVDAKIDLVQERTFTGTVVAKDTSSVAVGGLIEERAADQESKVPFLGDIPILGFFFRETAKARERKELVIIIKPHIMGTPNEAASVSNHVLKENSIHPEAQNVESLDIYSNPDNTFKGYVLDKPYKEYDKQDTFDKYRGRGDSREFNQNRKATTQQAPAQEAPVSLAQQTYVELTRYASEGVHLQGAERKIDPKIKQVRLTQFVPVDLLYDTRIKALPVAGWRQGGIYVTVLELHNTSNDRLRLTIDI